MSTGWSGILRPHIDEATGGTEECKERLVGVPRETRPPHHLRKRPRSVALAPPRALSLLVSRETRGGTRCRAARLRSRGRPCERAPSCGHLALSLSPRTHPQT